MKGKRYIARAALVALASAVSALALSCEISSGLLSESERSSLYTLTVSSSDGTPLSNGSVVYPGSSLVATVAKKSGATDPVAFDLSLAAPDGSKAAALRFASAAAAKSASTLSTKSVSSVDGKLEGFSVPAAASGLYTLSLSLSGSDGSALQSESIALFVGSAQPRIDSVSVFPPSVEPSASVLLSLTASWIQLPAPSGSSPIASADASAKRDPWIRWSKDGAAFASGLLSEGFNKVVWTAPSVEGAYSIAAEVFPAAPASGSSYSFKAAASQELKVMVIAASGGSGNDFADPLGFYSLLKLDGSFADSGTRPRTSQPAAFGSPRLETYSSGFGYGFGPDSGVTIGGLMPPSSSGMLGAFALLFRLDASSSDGILLRFSSSDKSYVLSFGLEGGRPYVESRSGGQTRRSVASSAIPQSPLTLEAVLKPSQDESKLDIAWRAEGQLIEAPSIDRPAAPPAGNATLGGPGSLPGVYDGFGLMLPGSSSSYPSPAFRLAMRRAWKSELILAESFEDGLPAKSSVSGATPSGSTAGLLLPAGSSLALSPSFGVGSGIVVAADIQGDRSSFRLAFSLPDGARVFAVSGTGEVSDASGSSLGSVGASGTALRLSVQQQDGSLYLVGPSSSVSLPGGAKQYGLSLSQESGSSLLRDLIVRSSASRP